MKIKMIILFIICSISSFGISNDYKGYWEMSDGKFNIKIEEIDGEYVGYVSWLKNYTYPEGDFMEGQEQVDRNNPVEELRTRKIMGLQVVGGLVEKDDKLVGGWVYDSWNGKKYYGTAWLEDHGTLILKGSIDKFGIFGKKMKAKRIYM